MLKNRCKLPTKEEDPEKFAKRRRKTEIKIERLTKQIASRIPQGRDLTGEKWLEALITATSTAPENEAQARAWQDRLLTNPKSVPFPVAYESNEDLTWSKNSTLARIKNPFPRPSQPLYQGQPHILVGVALGLDKPATAAVVDGTTGEAIAYRSIKQLLGDNYKLLNHQRQQKRSSSHQRHKAQKKRLPINSVNQN